MPDDSVASLNLPQITLVAVSSVALDATARALALSMEQAAFSRALLLSDHEPPAGLPKGVVWRKIEPLDSQSAYSRFLFRGLAAHIDTTHVLVVQWDGYVLDSGAWDPAFLDYDYIGAPWPHLGDTNVVGNGGFSLRSKRLLEILSNYELGRAEAEDLAICRRLRPELEDNHAIRFAPPDVAARFAWERMPRSSRSFGFHGAFNMAEIMKPPELFQLLRNAGPRMVRPRERKEMVLALIRRGEFLGAARLLMLFWRHRQRHA